MLITLRTIDHEAQGHMLITPRTILLSVDASIGTQINSGEQSIMKRLVPPYTLITLVKSTSESHEETAWKMKLQFHSKRRFTNTNDIISTRKSANNSGEQLYCGDPKAIISSRTYANNPNRDGSRIRSN